MFGAFGWSGRQYSPKDQTQNTKLQKPIAMPYTMDQYKNVISLWCKFQAPKIANYYYPFTFAVTTHNHSQYSMNFIAVEFVVNSIP